MMSRTAQEMTPEMDENSETVRQFLENDRQGVILQVIVDQFVANFERAVGVGFTAHSCHDDTEKIRPCDYTIYQSFAGDFVGEVHLRLSRSQILRVTNSMMRSEETTVDELTMDGAREFHNIVNGIICMQLGEMGQRVDLKPPRALRHHGVSANLGRPFDFLPLLGGARLTVVTLRRAQESFQLCIVDRSP